VTIGQLNRGKRAGCPVIGDNVFIGPGAMIIGHIKIGDNAAIGANCVVVEDVPAHAVVAGVPGKIISQEGSIGYINRIDY
jgi:serine O-acetyltransferase